MVHETGTIWYPGKLLILKIVVSVVSCRRPVLIRHTSYVEFESHHGHGDYRAPQRSGKPSGTENVAYESRLGQARSNNSLLSS